MSRRAGAAVALSALALALPLTGGCAAARRRATVPVYWVTAPPFAYRSLGEVRAVARDDRAHLDDVLDDAGAQAAAMGADALVIRDVRTEARWVTLSNMRTCSQVGIGGLPMPMTCPGRTGALELETSLVASAVERVGPRAASEVERRWPAPPPLQGAAPTWRERSVASPPWPDLDETLPVP